MEKSQINIEIDEALLAKQIEQLKSYRKFWWAMYIIMPLTYLVLTLVF